PLQDSHLELFFADKPMTLARWPNGSDYAKIAGTVPGSDISFTYTGDRPSRWIAEPDPWVYGYWHYDWADEYIPITKIDPATHTITMDNFAPSFGILAGQRFYALNLLSELDEPGEWYLDRKAGMLYFWPPAPLEANTAVVSLAHSLVEMKDTSYVSVRGMTLEVTRGTAATITGGSHDSIIGCTVRNTGGRGIDISGGDHHSVVACDIYRTSDGGVSLSGGDRNTLTPCGHLADNNDIYDYSRWDHTYRPAIGVDGDGVRVTHNRLHDGQHDAIQLGGNDHLIEFNEIYHVAYDTGDVGAFYTGRNWTARGTILRYNYFHDIQGPGHFGAMGIYLDDQASGFTVFGNLFNNVTRAVFIGGGVDNTVDNNLFVNCTPSVHLDDRGLNWQKNATLDTKDTLQSSLRAVPYTEAPWKDRYPNLVHILDDNPGTPKRNVFIHNIAVGGKWDDISQNILQFQTVKDNLPDQKPDILMRIGDRFQLRPGAGAAIGFQPIPVEKMGLYRSAERVMLPLDR
ncbi:MAG: right-handed parallel beta-helix repeat-containing protein, partial [Armatimonadota bacterium]|nr:right-handed parallel beta-helix repeat-containing protein [Armatimonadota bacterium]